MAINESLGLDDADLIQQLAAIEKKNELLELSQIETQQTLKLLEKVNADLVLKDEALQDQISQYQEITKDLLAINDSLGLKDASLIEQLEAIRSKNQKLAELNNLPIEFAHDAFSDVKTSIALAKFVHDMDQESWLQLEMTMNKEKGNCSS